MVTPKYAFSLMRILPDGTILVLDKDELKNALDSGNFFALWYVFVVTYRRAPFYPGNIINLDQIM